MKRQPTFLEAISTILVMIVIVITGFVVFEIPIQALLILSSAYAALIARRVGLKWQDLEEGITYRLATAMPAIFIILSVGIIVGTWMFSGTVPALIYYGLEFLNPNLFLVSAFIICAITSVATGTAWGSASTAGIALMAIATQLHIPAGMAAGAIIAGAVFGDKMSPLSDTTNLAALVTKVNIFSHIRAMIWTTVPASIIGLIVWYIAGRQFGGNTNTSNVNALLNELSQIYNINIFVWLPLIIIIICLLIKISTVPAMLISSLSAIIVGVFNNGFNVVDGFKATFDGFNKGMVSSSNGALTDRAIGLIEQGGMMSMTEIVVTIFCGYAFAGIVEKSGCLDVILNKISKNINSVGQLILATVLGGIMMVLAAGVASVVIIMVGVLLMEMYNKMGLDRTNLSRTLEDSGTMIIPLIPWGTSGIYYTQQLGVTVDQFFIWTVPCYLCIVFALFYGFSGIGIKKVKTTE
ncbi:Na+/H+ antiporter NhaC [Staphylococcus pseudoxylosus]|uniref:Na+/H+ antiporter NhaC n=1 Tax=Staphylococcus pseudoxylosus TaxID=2282419 RepID=A0AAQ0MGH0_9STAP|nr:Na+/H+ antiporter NhaC [Staphylococcus pseudoxylosus]PTI81000.1 Na+/H+ antiporter NhaC [Staphylococcus xylosus]MBM2657211.1 Na+/H+ antiporter NhaC [Staphylococcus pseudoxylosus]MCE5002671.1 Na+/H+ antiporter NhaC [Staphylococcus pseudoxylosus]MEB5783937.1 Na+/H+ antiporter NhaC [Staphylococcus pseudoxylosus]MEB6333103.1 Na+/H+ antiporter NhaC [Staphylococcus pseudoxylosus]